MITKEEALKYHSIIEQELRDTFTKKATPQWASVIDDLLKSMKYLEEIAYGDHEYPVCEKPADMTDTMVDDYLMTMYDEFKSYKEYKKTYNISQSADDKQMMIDELSHMLNSLSDLIKELWSNTDCEEERSVMLTKLRMTHDTMK